MVEISDALRTVFTGTIERRDENYVIEVPMEEVSHGTIRENSVYRVALLNTPGQQVKRRPESVDSTPPVSEGEQRTVTIEAVGREGDGIAKVERGYVIIVPGGEPGEEIEVEIERVTPSVAFANATDHEIASEPTSDETPSA
ncbi:TRAM domain-containing protein [Halocatena pleomorpha]|uniref:TRAM domain-containing protein n=1 Tax=Halocatena pleomorpha TaxID=1785090 RepID=A0A3P3RJV7_9EURY|nr:TRAM domain-containing protein [Halocatena pleomorpha]RRJ33665.1 TRAM domain-containing protein [Halocatena pleomorpha]